jgi:hypothetical protein
MKELIIMAALLACSPAVANDNPLREQREVYMAWNQCEQSSKKEPAELASAQACADAGPVRR